MIEKECPNCKRKQLWDVVFGYQHRECPELCCPIYIPFPKDEEQ